MELKKTSAYSWNYSSSTNIVCTVTHIRNCNEFPSEFINSFFPLEIEEAFSDVTYSYRAENADSYGFEAFLEFTIKDEEQFERYVSSICPTEKWENFRYDEDYDEYCIADTLKLTPQGTKIGELVLQDTYIDYAQIGKILVSYSEQRIVYIAIGVYDGGGAATSYLCRYFERFNIDPLEYNS